MTTIHAITNDQQLAATILPQVACNNQKTVRLHVEFDDSWSGYAKSAVFYTSSDPTPYEVIFSAESNADVPPEVLAKAGMLYIGVKGVDRSGGVKTSAVINYKILPGTPTAVISNPPTNVYNQILTAYNSAAEAIADETASRKINDAAEKAERQADIANVNARISNLASLSDGSTTGDAELQDIRFGNDGVTYASAGDAVRTQFKTVTDDLKAFKSVSPADIVFGSVSGGVEVEMYNRARLAERIKAYRTVISVAVNSNYLFGYTVYDDNGVYDGVDHGWNSMDGRTLTFDSGFVHMNFIRTDGATMTLDDLAALSASVTITTVSALNEIDDLKQTVYVGLESEIDYMLEVGSINLGANAEMANRARVDSMIPVTAKTKAILEASDTYMYGYACYDMYGNFDGVDHGWNNPTDAPVVEFYEPGFVRFNFRRRDDANISTSDINALYELLTITDRYGVDDLRREITKNQAQNEHKRTNDAALASINIEHGRYKDASYVFARIPKTLNDGRTITPKVRITTDDGSIDGAKCSVLEYARKYNPVFICNAGLFNMSTMIPLGQTVIDGMVYVDTPMTDDNGSAISDAECYPLCIDNSGDLSAPYARSASASDMVMNGIVHAVTGWGKVIDEFRACSDTVENEIVHAGKYIRQVIGQFQTGDYFVCTVDMSRNGILNEAGITYADLAQLLISKGVKFAYSLDGGGSAETVIGKRQLNPIYEGDAGRAVPTVIEFSID